MSSYINSFNMLLVSQTNTKFAEEPNNAHDDNSEGQHHIHSDFGGSENEFAIANRIIERLKNLALASKFFLNNFVSNDTIALVDGMRLVDNCPLIDDVRVACFDNTSSTIIGFGLDAYYSYVLSTQLMLTAYLNSTTLSSSTPEKVLGAVTFKQLFSLQSLNFG